VDSSAVLAHDVQTEVAAEHDAVAARRPGRLVGDVGNAPCQATDIRAVGIDYVDLQVPREEDPLAIRRPRRAAVATLINGRDDPVKTSAV
jgi:hypothetical protein